MQKLNIPVVGSYHTDFDAYLRYYKIEFLSNMLWNYLKWFHSHMQKILYLPLKHYIN